MERGREDEGVLRACFEVKQVAFNLTAAESGDLTDFSAEEYLSWVAHQARTLPDVVRVNGPPLMEESCNRSGPYREEEEEGVVELDLLPDRSWEAEFLARFLSLKEVCIVFYVCCPSS